VATTTVPLPAAAKAQQAAAVAEPQQPATEVVPQQSATEVEPQQPTAWVEPQPAAPMTVATMAAAVATPPTSPVPAAVGGLGAAVVEIPDDDDVPLPG
jgi:hypothetical protein